MVLKATEKLVLAFVALIVGVSLVGVIASESLGVTDKTVVTNEAINIAAARLGDDLSINETNAASNFTVTNYPTNWKITDCPITVSAYGNSTADWTVNTDYEVFAAQGIIHVLNTTATEAGASNATLVDYTYCGDKYLNSSWGRTSLTIVSGLFAIALLLTAVGLFYSVGKDYGLY